MSPPAVDRADLGDVTVRRLGRPPTLEETTRKKTAELGGVSPGDTAESPPCQCHGPHAWEGLRAIAGGLSLLGTRSLGGAKRRNNST